MADETIWFGRPGHLVPLHQPRGGVRAGRARPVAEFELGSGGRRVGTLVGGKRRYSLNWQSLSYEDFAALEAFTQGHEGPGPFALLDPGRRNLLTVNQSSATSETNATDNFTPAGSGVTLTSTTTVVRRGPRALAMNFAVAGSGMLLCDSPSDEWPGIPVVNRPLVFAVQARGGGTDPVVTLTPQLRWYDTAGALLSTSSGTPAATSSGAWTQLQVTASPPADAAYVNAAVSASGASVSAGSVVYLDELQLEEGTTASEWRPGTGVLPVSVLSLAESWPWGWPDYRDGPTLVLQEVGP